ncbi:putative sensor domain DACNV-containing protein [Sorangium sp. So ce406]|uniref:putative sensor domain DACNV-containing protein n=1 Tax=Sorangium sp. So ce406 TaxID=3133311 RepID=UPI003F5BEAE6
MALKTIPDVVDTFIREHNKEHLIVQELLRGRSITPSTPTPIPSRAILIELADVMFVASISTEEGRLSPAGIVYANDLGPFEAERPAWDFIRFASPLMFNDENVVKLASACAYPRSFLAVIPAETALLIAGITTPHSRHFLDGDRLIRIIASRPGVLAICVGERDIVRYERGILQPRTPKSCPHVDSIERTILGDYATILPDAVFDNLMRIVKGMVELAHGGLLAILGPDESLEHLLGKDQALLGKKSKRIAPPVDLGSAIFSMYEAHLVDNSNDQKRFWLVGDELRERTPTAQEARDAYDAQKATERVDRMIDQIIRLTTVDGAVVMSHKLEVLAFGAKLPPPREGPAPVFTMSHDQEQAAWPLETRGTRHYAAAAFVAQYPERLSVVVSQDGHAAAFKATSSDIRHFPL